MSNMYVWERPYEVLGRTATMWASIMQQIDVTCKLSNMTSVIEMAQSSFNTMQRPSSLELLCRHMEAFNNFEQINLSKLFGVGESIQNVLKEYDFSAITSAFDNLARINISQELFGMSAALEAYDPSKLASAIGSVFTNIVVTDTLNISDVVEDVTEQYIDENELSDAAAEEIRTVTKIKDKGLLNEQQLKVWEVYIYPFLVSFFFFILASRQPEPSTTNNITYVNNYYTTEVGIEVDVLNEYNFRIVCNNNVMPRIKPDCSSRVVDHLPLGKVVCVVGKYKKWVEITWKNDKGEYCSGWVQNYKLEKFK